MAEQKRIDLKIALNAEILAQGHSEDKMNHSVPVVVKPKQSIANQSTTEWNIGASAGPGGTFQEHWPEHLPRPPSMKKLTVDETTDDKPNMPSVIVFNANTKEGGSMVRVLSEKGLKVVAVVRVFTSRNAKALIKLKNVTVKIADLNNLESVCQAAQGCQQAFLVTKYWERFESPIEEQMAHTVIDASAKAGIKRLILATFEDTAELRARNVKSQIIPTKEGLIYPKFEGMEAIHRVAKSKGIVVTHMFTSYLDEKDSKKSLILIRSPEGKILSQPFVQETKKK